MILSRRLWTGSRNLKWSIKMIYEITTLIAGIYGILGILFGLPFKAFAIGYGLTGAVILSIERIYSRKKKNENK